MSDSASGILRPAEAELDGYAWLPRMLDKARADQDGVETGFPFGCPVDHTCMARLEIGPRLVRDLVARHGADDEAILAELRSRGIPPAERQWFDAPAVEAALQRGGPYLRVRGAEELPQDPAAGGRVLTGGEHGAGVSIVLIDAPVGYRQDPHSHPTEEVVAVHAGAATVHLGDAQARTITAREVVRVPAGVTHWLENRGGESLCAVAAYGAAAIVTTG